jgi:hypothetical protein
VDVAVDQARHEGPPVAIQHDGTGGLDRPIGDLADAVALDQHRHAVAEVVLGRIEEPGVAEQDLAHGGHSALDRRAPATALSRR